MLINMQKNKSIFKVLTVVPLCFALIVSVSGCGQQYRPSDINTDTEGGSSQLHSFIIPKSLLGGQTGEDTAAQFNDPSTTVLLASGKEIPISQFYSDIYANDDRTATFVFTTEQLEVYKQEIYTTASLHSFISEDGSSFVTGASIKSTEFTSDNLTDIVVYADKNTYDNSGTDGNLAKASATFMGLYQIMNGADPYGWHVHVTVKDDETGEVITEDDYPPDR